MIYDNTELRILEQIWLKEGIHKRELSKQLKLGMPSIDYALKKIERVLKKKRFGNQIIYFLDYSKEDLTPLLYMVEYSRMNKLPAKVKLTIYDFLTEMKEKPIIAAIFGSYARGDYTKNSDIDVLLVFQKLENEKQIENWANRVSMRTNITINPVYINYDTFRESFYDSRKKFFKNLKKDKIIIVGIEWWRQLKNEEA